ncbi:MAG TPA: DUF5134 domain-containing protein [Jatrophihabitantaceae bacterium]|jgi:hypothetical protein
MTSALRWLVTAAMAVAMVPMLAGSLTRPAAQWWALGFGAATAWFGWAALRTYVLDGVRAAGPPTAQAVCCAAMCYMPLAMAPAVSSMPDMARPASAGPVAVTASLAGALTAVCLVTARGFARAPSASGGCQFAMGAAGVYMLATLL